MWRYFVLFRKKLIESKLSLFTQSVVQKNSQGKTGQKSGHGHKDAFDVDPETVSPYDDASNINGGNPYNQSLKNDDSGAPGGSLQEEIKKEIDKTKPQGPDRLPEDAKKGEEKKEGEGKKEGKEAKKDGVKKGTDKKGDAKSESKKEEKKEEASAV